MDYYKRYMGDYQRDTGDLSLAQHGAFTVLLDHYYSVRKPLPAAMEKLHRLCRATTKTEQDAVETVVTEFFPMGEDGLRHNERADEEIAKWEVFAEENREKGKLGGRPKKNPSGNPSGNPPGNPMGSGGSQEETQRVSNGLAKGVVSETRTKPYPDPNPDPDPKPKPIQRHSENARARGEGESIATNGHDPPIDSLPYEQAIMAGFPTGPNPPNWGVALHNARELVSNDLATWQGLVDVTERYGRYLAAGGATVNVAAHNFFDRRKGSHWQQSWDPPASKAETRLDSNIAAAAEAKRRLFGDTAK